MFYYVSQVDDLDVRITVAIVPSLPNLAYQAKRSHLLSGHYRGKNPSAMKIDRITANPHILGGKPTIRGTRLSVEFILDLFAFGMSEAEILEDYSHITAAIFRTVCTMPIGGVDPERCRG